MDANVAEEQADPPFLAGREGSLPRAMCSEWMRLVRAESEAGLNENTVDVTSTWRAEPLVRRHELRELAWEPFEIPGASR